MHLNLVANTGGAKGFYSHCASELEGQQLVLVYKWKYSTRSKAGILAEV